MLVLFGARGSEVQTAQNGLRRAPAHGSQAVAQARGQELGRLDALETRYRSLGRAACARHAAVGARGAAHRREPLAPDRCGAVSAGQDTLGIDRDAASRSGEALDERRGGDGRLGGDPQLLLGLDDASVLDVEVMARGVLADLRKAGGTTRSSARLAPQRGRRGAAREAGEARTEPAGQRCVRARRREARLARAVTAAAHDKR
mmetsp:Transcript_11252/g.35915  ORF Transcript_11252/g.35915 Transcript_11252/m.35915 type:complete len:203 (+) Transcript_11252:1402-2010(+)